MAPLVLAMRGMSERFAPIVCVTGQHREMLDQVLNTFQIRPDYDLAVMTKDQSLAQLTARVLAGIDEVLVATRPDVLMVQGDTTTAFAGALSAFYRRVRVAHVEAGLRTGDLENPFPEEANRILIDQLADLCFAPTELNRRALRAEGVAEEKIFVTGNTGVDALLLVRNRVQTERAERWRPVWNGALAAIEDRSRKLILITAHRRESFGERFNAIFSAIGNLARQHPAWEFVYPVHLNPNVREAAHNLLADLSNVHLLAPLAYEPFVYLMDRASLILTDSGGIQEEAPSLGKAVVVMRETTERHEALDAGTVTLAGNTGSGLEQTVERLMSDEQLARRAERTLNPYGDGRASQRILGHVAKQFASS